MSTALLPTSPAVLTIVARQSSGWSGYDRGIRDTMTDARFAAAKGDDHGFAHWAQRALTAAVLDLRGVRHTFTAEQMYDAADEAATMAEAMGLNAEAVRDAREATARTRRFWVEDKARREAVA